MIALFDGRPALRRAVFWAVPIVLLVALIGVELYRGSAQGDAVPPVATRPPNPVNVAVLPLTAAGTGDDALSAIGERTLFKPHANSTACGARTRGGAAIAMFLLFDA